MANEIQDVVSDVSVYKWTPTGGSELDITAYVKKFDWGSDSNTETNTAFGFGLETEQRIRGKIAPKMTLAWRDSVAGAAVRAALYEGQTGVLTEAPEGTGAGKPKFGARLQVKKANTPSEVGKLRMIEVELTNIGDDWEFHPSNGDTY